MQSQQMSWRLSQDNACNHCKRTGANYGFQMLLEDSCGLRADPFPRGERGPHMDDAHAQRFTCERVSLDSSFGATCAQKHAIYDASESLA